MSLSSSLPVRSLRRLCLLCGVWLCAASASWGQANDSLLTFSVGFTPQHLAQNALRIDLEKEIGQRRHRIAISPYLYHGYTGMYDPNQRRSSLSNIYDRVRGVGGEVMYKYRVSRQEKNGYPFFAVGLGFHQVRLHFEELAWQPFRNEEELEFLRLLPAEQRERVQRLDLIGLIGYRAFVANVFALDFYIGASSRYASVQSTIPTPRNHQMQFTMYGYEGVLLRTGATFSIMLK